MVKTLKSILGFCELLFSWLPPYLASFISLLFSVLATVFLLFIVIKFIAAGINLLKG